MKDLAHERARLHRESASLRYEAIRTRILVLPSWCAIAETCLAGHSTDQARAILTRIRRAFTEIEYHLGRPEHVTASAAGSLWPMLRGIEPRIRELERRISPEP